MASTGRRSWGVGVRILLVEDNDDLRNEIRDYLSRRGHDVTACGALAGARAAMDGLVASATPPEAIICDANLPDGNGIDFFVATAISLSKCKWVLMSGAHDSERVDRLKDHPELPQCTIVEKPVSLRVLNGALS